MTSAAAATFPQLHITKCSAGEGRFPRITLNHLHWLSSGVTSFARGVNDTPKMVAILIRVALLSPDISAMPLVWFAAIVAGIVVGSWVAGRRVTEMLAMDVTRMDHREGLMANMITATLVASGATLGWPMSTTQVASGAIIGIASTGKETINWKSARAMLLAWIATVPAAGVLGIVSYVLLCAFGVR